MSSEELSPEVLQRIATNRARALERRAEIERQKLAARSVSSASNFWTDPGPPAHSPAGQGTGAAPSFRADPGRRGTPVRHGTGAPPSFRAGPPPGRRGPGMTPTPQRSGHVRAPQQAARRKKGGGEQPNIASFFKPEPRSSAFTSPPRASESASMPPLEAVSPEFRKRDASAVAVVQAPLPRADEDLPLLSQVSSTPQTRPGGDLASTGTGPAPAKRRRVSAEANLARFSRAPAGESRSSRTDTDRDAHLANSAVLGSPASPPQASPFVARGNNGKQLTPPPASGKMRRWDWLENVRDIEQRRPGDPGYDQSTLFIPRGVLEDRKTLTDAKRMYWRIKQYHFDTIVWFQQGTFFNVFERDADVCHEGLGLAYTGGALHPSADANQYSAGVSHHSLEKHNSRLLACGYRCCIVSQDHGVSKPKGGEDVQRTLDRVFTPGTITDASLLSDDACFLVTVWETQNTLPEDHAEVALAILDAAGGRIQLALLEDDALRSRSEALFLTLGNIKELIVAHDNLSEAMSIVLERTTGAKVRRTNSSSSGAVCVNILRQQREGAGIPASTEYGAAEFWTPANTDSFLEDKCTRLSSAVLEGLSQSMSLKTVLGGLFGYLHRVRILEMIVMQNQFSLLEAHQQVSSPAGPLYVRLDAVTLRNLDLVDCHSSSAPSNQVSLLSFLQSAASTAMGKRLLRQWVARPLARTSAIQARLRGVSFLRESAIFDPDEQRLRTADIRARLRSLPDLDRLFSKVLQGLAPPAVIAEYLLAMGDACEILQDVLNSDLPETSALWSSIRESCFEHLRIFLNEVEEVFDAQESLQSSKLVVRSENSHGDSEFHALLAELGIAQQRAMSASASLNDLLRRVQAAVSGNAKFYDHRTKGRFLFELPTTQCRSSSWNECTAFLGTVVEMDSIKNKKRFQSSVAQDLAEELAAAERECSAIEQSVGRALCRYLCPQTILPSGHCSERWTLVSSAVAMLDASVALAQLADQHDWTVPVVGDASADIPPIMKFVDVVNPVLQATVLPTMVPNSLSLGVGTEPGSSESGAILLTGANMGGKSTILRTICVATVLVQIGSCCPAQECTLREPVDAICARIGCYDDVLRGKSTFAVELTETASILRQCSTRSLCVFDELGRGTATHDGMAIAHSVLESLVGPAMQSQSLHCPRVLFATHYHELALSFGGAEWTGYCSVKHMDCFLDDETREVIFLYTLVDGAEEGGSYGLSVAKMAGLNEAVLTRARTAAQDLARRTANQGTHAVALQLLTAGGESFQRTDRSALALALKPSLELLTPSQGPGPLLRLLSFYEQMGADH